MKSRASLLILLMLAILVLNQACHTLYNPKTISIDIMEPARVKLPDNFQNVAVRYNNVNVAWNPNTAEYLVEGKIQTDSTNLDSIASKVYFDLFISTLKEQHFFKRVTEVEATDYSHTQIIDTLTTPKVDLMDSTLTQQELTSLLGAHILAAEIKKTKPAPNPIRKKKYINPEFGLYSAEEIAAIADTCTADVLLSLDHFYTQNGISYFNHNGTAREAVLVHYSWTAYDLKKQKLAFHFSKADTVYWSHMAAYKKEAMRSLPPRKDAVLNAADIAGGNTAKFLVPHWNTVQRIYYEFDNLDIIPTRELIEQGKWLEAAEIWKRYANVDNKSTAARCKFNMALACEMNDQIEAALEWVVDSYHVFGEKNEYHAANCKEYIRILAQRKQDRNIMNRQFNIE